MNRPARGLLVAFGVALLGAGALAGCGNDDAAGDESETTTTETSTTTTPPTTEPPATDVEAVRPIIEELAADYDAALAAVLVEPDQVLDPESPVHEQLAAVFTDDELARRVERFEQNANRGIVFSPLGPEPLWVTTVVGEIEPDGPDALRVVICTTYHYRKTSPEGGEERDGLSHPGWLYAAREDGVWQVSRVESNSMQLCDPDVRAGGA